MKMNAYWLPMVVTRIANIHNFNSSDSSNRRLSDSESGYHIDTICMRMVRHLTYLSIENAISIIGRVALYVISD